MMRISNVLFGLLLLLCVACSKSEKETPSGLKFKVVKVGDGVLPKVQEIVAFHYIMKDSKDSVWTDTYKEGFPAAIMTADSSAIADENGMLQMLRMVSKGDSITLEIPLKNFFKDMLKRPVPAGMDTTLIFSYQVSVTNIMSRDDFMAFQEEFMKKREVEQFQKDITAIDSYLTEKNITAEKTESGLRYIITQPGKGENGKPGQTAKIHYVGHLLSGEIFDTTVKTVAQDNKLYHPGREPYGPFEVVIDKTNLISGWHEALKLMNKGSKATFYLPSKLAYGPQQRGATIKANSILVFEMELVDLK